MRRETQNILLVLLGGALLKISFTGTYLRYVKAQHQWLLITAGVIMVLLALVSIGRDLVPSRVKSAGADTGAEEAGNGEAAGDREVAAVAAEGAGHHHHQARSAWLLLLPVLAVFVIAPPALGSDAVQRSAATNQASAPADGSALFPALPAGEVVALPLSDFCSRAAWDSGNSLNGRTIRLVGFIVHDGEATYIARLVIGCCSADAFPIKVKLEGQDLSTVPDDTWIEATVTVQPGSATKENEYIPTANLTAFQQIPQPDDPYEH